MVKTLEQYKKEADILKNAKKGIRKERIRNLKSKVKKVASDIGSYRIKKTKRPSIQKRIANTIKYRKKLSSNLMNQFTGGSKRNGTQQRVKEGPGRPRGDYKHRDPQTGQPIPATIYYKRIKELKRQAEQAARLRDIQAIQEMGKRGIPPEQSKQIIDTRQLQSVGVQSQVQIQPQRISPQISPEMQRRIFIQQLQRQQQGVPSQAVRPIWRRQNTQRYERDIFGNVKIIQGGNDPKNFWN